MRLGSSRFLVILVAVAFLALWLAGVSAAYASPVQEPLANPGPAETSQAVTNVGIAGWCIIGTGFLGVAVTAFFTSRSRRRRRITTSHPSRSRAYHPNVERRY